MVIAISVERRHSDLISVANRAASASRPLPTITAAPTAATLADIVLDTRRPGGSAAASAPSQSPVA
jgi:DNA-binding MurR/RpiR family transcriptional regulator